MTSSHRYNPLRLLLIIAVLLFLAESSSIQVLAAGPVYPVCTQPTLTPTIRPASNDSILEHQLYLPLILGLPPLPTCTVYCGLAPTDDPYRPAGYRTYFADEFDCNQLLAYWTVQGQMTVASYTPPVSGYVEVNNGALQVGVPGSDTSFPYLYMVDDSATGYDVPHTTRRVDWLPNQGDFRRGARCG